VQRFYVVVFRCVPLKFFVVPCLESYFNHTARLASSLSFPYRYVRLFGFSLWRYDSWSSKSSPHTFLTNFIFTSIKLSFTDFESICYKIYLIQALSFFQKTTKHDYLQLTILDQAKTVKIEVISSYKFEGEWSIFNFSLHCTMYYRLNYRQLKLQVKIDN
jgi:hypothetical protein